MSDTGDLFSKRNNLYIRIQAGERDLIDRAARLRGKNRTDFILEAARRAAEEALLEQVVMLATPEQHAAFLARLDAPPSPSARLLQTMQTPAPWPSKA